MTDTASAAPLPTVLVVDDEAMVAMLVAEILADAGYRPACAPDGRAALAAAKLDAGASAAVVDLHLAGGEDGRQVVQRLRERRPDLPVVVVTGYHPEAPEADLRGLGGPTLRLCKPFVCDDLAGSVSAVMDAPAARTEPRRRRSDLLMVPA